MKAAALLSLLPLTSAKVLWDGRFNDLSSSSDLNKWSWANQVGPYQYYIHGSGDVTKYVNLSPSYKNPNDTASKQGVKITLDSTAYWNGQNMRRTELIPQTKAAIASGKVWYHFSISRKDVNAPSVFREHQIAFFESHFTELKSGWISGEQATSNTNLQFMVQGKSLWKTEWKPDVWHNVAYEINFSSGSVGFWHSEGGAPLQQVVAPVSASTSSNGQDWHLGVLELPRNGYADTDEDFYFSGVYVEDGAITTSVTGPGRFK
ncbi:carbohydrate-binding module family 1 protein [Colletotrichum tofieldiae]|nr:carbohydrate-binding module family 1 protein [Colletotrichum tofieldiae]